jgi:hypothetical protein
MAVAAGSVVEDLDIIEDVSSGEVAGFIDAFLNALLLHAREEWLCDSIVPAVGTPAHAGTHQRDGVVVALLVHEAVLHSGSLATYRAAFLRDPAPLSVAVANAGAEPRSWFREVPVIAARIGRVIRP